MEQLYESSMHLIETAGIWAPVCFIILHVIRPILFVPVILICLTGGLLFGSIWGTAYSLVGITLSSLVFYKLRTLLPKPFQKIEKLKVKLLGSDKNPTAMQIAVLRLLPFMHFYLLSLCLYDITTDFKDYAKQSFYTNIPLAFIYTAFGGWITKLPPVVTFIIIIGFAALLMKMKRKEPTVIGWEEFAQAEPVKSQS